MSPHTRPGGLGCSPTPRVLTAASPGSGLPVGALPVSSSAPTLSACPRHCRRTRLPPQSPTYHVTPWLKTPQRPRRSPKVAQDHCLAPLLGRPSPGVPHHHLTPRGPLGPFSPPSAFHLCHLDAHISPSATKMLSTTSETEPSRTATGRAESFAHGSLSLMRHLALIAGPASLELPCWTRLSGSLNPAATLQQQVSLSLVPRPGPPSPRPTLCPKAVFSPNPKWSCLPEGPTWHIPGAPREIPWVSRE